MNYKSVIFLLAVILFCCSAYGQVLIGIGPHFSASGQKTFEMGAIKVENDVIQDTSYVARTFNLGAVSTAGIELHPILKTNTFGEHTAFASLPMSFGYAGSTDDYTHYAIRVAAIYNIGFNLDLEDKKHMSGISVGLGLGYSYVQVNGKESVNYTDNGLTDFSKAELEYDVSRAYPFSLGEVAPVITANFLSGGKSFFTRSMIGFTYRPSLGKSLPHFEGRYIFFF